MKPIFYTMTVVSLTVFSGLLFSCRPVQKQDAAAEVLSRPKDELAWCRPLNRAIAIIARERMTQHPQLGVSSVRGKLAYEQLVTFYEQLYTELRSTNDEARKQRAIDQMKQCVQYKFDASKNFIFNVDDGFQFGTYAPIYRENETFGTYITDTSKTVTYGAAGFAGVMLTYPALIGGAALTTTLGNILYNVPTFISSAYKNQVPEYKTIPNDKVNAALAVTGGVAGGAAAWVGFVNFINEGFWLGASDLLGPVLVVTAPIGSSIGGGVVAVAGEAMIVGIFSLAAAGVGWAIGDAIMTWDSNHGYKMQKGLTGFLQNALPGAITSQPWNSELNKTDARLSAINMFKFLTMEFNPKDLKRSIQ